MRVLTPICILVLLGFCFGPAYAQAEEGEAFYVPYEEMTRLTLWRPSSSAERVGMAFYKMAGTQPDFEPWAPLTVRSKRVPEYERGIVALQELSRLQNEYENLRLEEPLVINSVIEVNNYSPQQETLFLDKISPQTLFKYDAYGLKVVLLAKGIGRFSKIKLPPKEADHFLNKLQGRDKAKLQIAVIPERAEPSRQVELHDGTYYPIIVRVAEFSIWTNDNDDPAQMWVYRAPWFDRLERNSNWLELYAR